MKSTVRTSALLVTSTLLASCSVLPWGSSSAEVSGPGALSDEERFEHWLTERVTALRAATDVPGVAISVVTDDFETHVSGGWADPASELPMTTETPVRIASNTKTFVACAALRLAERGELDLDLEIGPLLPYEWTKLLEADGYRCGEITVRQLLTHTAGVFEHVRAPQFMQRVQTQRDAEWTAEAQVRLAVEAGDPTGAPGERFEYSDTGYVLLGRILERTQEKPLAEVVRDELALRRLGLNDTWWEREEPTPSWAEPRAHQYLGDVDTHDWDPSMDLFGGGGLLSTTEDLATFFDRLFEGDVFSEHGTLSAMLSPEGLPDGTPYRIGMFADRVDGRVAWQHSGFWGTFAVRVPSLRTSIAVVVTCQDAFGAARALVEDAVAWLGDPPAPVAEVVAPALPEDGVEVTATSAGR